MTGMLCIPRSWLAPERVRSISPGRLRGEYVSASWYSAGGCVQGSFSTVIPDIAEITLAGLKEASEVI